MNKKTCVVSACAAALLISMPLIGRSAQVIGDTHSLLNTASANQLESWLGQGPVTLNNIFSKKIGDRKNSNTFHNAADGQGPTFTVMDVAVNSAHQIVGGYDLQSGSTIGNWNLTFSDSQRTAFLFNLTSSVRQNQPPSTAPSGLEDTGFYQTSNDAGGPAFGGGFDLAAYVSDLEQGYASQYSYGGNGILFGGVNILCGTGVQIFPIASMEVFTIAVVPEAPPYRLMLLLPLVAGTLRILHERK
jgi:hypothetical protein